MNDDYQGESGGGPGSAEDILEALVASTCAALASDPSQPSITLSKLTTGQWYASVCRYTQPYGDGKVTVCSARAADLRGALVELETKWKGHALNTPPAPALPSASLAAVLEKSIDLARGNPADLATAKRAILAARIRPTEREALLKKLGAA